MEEDPNSQRTSGTGKRHIAIGLDLAACQKGLSVGFITAATLIHELIGVHDDKRLLRLQRQLASCKLLIIDELGYEPLSQTGAELLFEVFSQRYERASTIITSNLPFVTQARGKQDWQRDPYVIWYSRTTGIWQTVWLEAVPSTSSRNLRPRRRQPRCRSITATGEYLPAGSSAAAGCSQMEGRRHPPPRACSRNELD